jgi:hypothetical protein
MRYSILALGVLTSYVCAQGAPVYVPTARVVPAGNGSASWYYAFGQSFDLDGTRMIVGAPSLGNVTSFVRSGESWTFESYLSDPLGGSSSAKRGYVVDLQGDEALIGAPAWYPGPGYYNVGAVGVMRRSGGSWNPVQTLTPNIPPTNSGAGFGRTLSRDGDRVLIGAPDEPTAGWYAGAAYVYEKDAGGTWIERAKLVRANGASQDYFGSAVALSGDTAVVAAAQAGGYSGSVSLFVRDDAGTPNDPSDDTWPLQAELTPTALDMFGFSVALQGDRLVIGAPWNDSLAVDAGAVHIYERTGTQWALRATLLASDGSASDLLGWGAMKLEGDRLLTTAHGNDQGGNNSGKVYLFEYDGAAWNEIRGFVDPLPIGGEDFGMAVAFDGPDRLLIGAPSHANPNHPSGVVVVLHREESYATLCPGDGTAGSCPCGNWGAPGQGCSSEVGQAYGARLRAFGSNSVAAHELNFVAQHLWVYQSALLFGGTGLVNGGLGTPLGAGLRCVATPLRRLGLLIPDEFGMARWGPNFPNGAPWLAGETWRFQVWYRAGTLGLASPCSQYTNTSSGVEVVFVP